MNSAVEDIKSRINIVDLIGEYIRVQKAGANWKALCPFHREKSPSFMINEEKQIWHCFGCGKGGDVFGFLMEIESIDFKETLKILAEKTGVELPNYRDKGQGTRDKDDRKKTLEILELATKFYEKQLWDGMGKEKILHYLRNRGLKDSSMKDFRLGYAPSGWDNLLKFLIGRGYKSEEISKTGLLVSKSTDNEQESANKNLKDKNTNRYYDRFRNRIMFPIMDVMGQVVGFSARVAPGGDESQAKYVNTPETEVYHKSKILYGINKAKQDIKSENSAIIVEGNMDVIAAHQAGVKNVIAVSGTALTGEQVDTLKRYSNKIKMLFDMDSAGEQATKRSAEICFQKDIDVSVITLDSGKDAAEIVQKNPKEFVENVEKSIPVMEYFFELFFRKYNKNKIEEKKVIAAELLNIIRNFGNDIEKSHWIKKLSEKLEVGENILIDSLKKVERRLKGDASRERSAEKGASKTRADVIREKIIGLVLSGPEIWEKFIADPESREYFAGDPRFIEIFQKGPEAKYRFQDFISILNDKETKDFLQKIYFEAKYSGGEKEMEENDLSDSKAQMEYCFNELKKEIGRSQLNILLGDIRKAEENNDEEGKKLLINEFNKLSQEIK